jgi:spore maturation protein CgeB
VPELFAVGDEVLAFRDFDELVGQATRLLNETSLTARRGAAAARRAHRDHTYELRVAAILEKVS